MLVKVTLEFKFIISKVFDDHIVNIHSPPTFEHVILTDIMYYV